MKASRDMNPATGEARGRENPRWRLLFRAALGVLAFFAVFGVIGTGYIVFRDSGTPLPRPDREVDALLDGAGFSGSFSVRISRFGNLIYSRDFPPGQTNEHTPFPIGNLGESFTALAIMILNDRKQLDVKQELGSILGPLPSGYERLSLESLLTHSSGLSPQQKEPEEEMPPPGKAPNQETVYSPANYRFLERVVAKVSGIPADQFVDREILTRLNMDHTSYTPETGWVSCSRDLMTFEESLILNPFVKMKTLLRAFLPPKLADGKRGFFGFGWSVEDVRGVRMEQAGGLAGGPEAVITRFSEKNLAIVILGRTDPPLNGREMGREVGEIYLGREMRPSRRTVK